MSYSTALPRRVTFLNPRPARQEPAREEQNPPVTVLVFLKQGIALYAEGRPLAAAVSLRRVTKAAPENAVGHYLLGLAYKSLGRHILAAEEWRAAASLPKTEGCDDWVRIMARKLLTKHPAVDNCALTNGTKKGRKDTAL